MHVVFCAFTEIKVYHKLDVEAEILFRLIQPLFPCNPYPTVIIGAIRDISFGTTFLFLLVVKQCIYITNKLILLELLYVVNLY